MKNPGNAKAVISATLCLMIICFVVTFAVSGTNAAFEDRIAQQEKAATEASMSELLVADEYELFTAEDGSDAYLALDTSGNTLGYIFITSSQGYGGAISVMTAISSDGEIIGINIQDCSNETPGLGQNITKDDFKNQFAGLISAPEVTKSTPTADNEIQALTGATKSSGGVTNAVRAAYELYEAAAD